MQHRQGMQSKVKYFKTGYRDFSLLQVICLPAGPSVQWLHSSRCCAFSLSFHASVLHHPVHEILFSLPLPLFPSILPSIISLCRELPLRTCLIQFFCLVGYRGTNCISQSTCSCCIFSTQKLYLFYVWCWMGQLFNHLLPPRMMDNQTEIYNFEN